jgi:hypothetical protein
VTPAAGAGATIAIGPLLRDSILLVLRHWLIAAIGVLVLAELALLNMSLLGRCFADFLPSCPSAVLTLGDRGEWLIHSALYELAGFVVASVAIYFLYSSDGSGVSQSAGLRRSKTQSLRLFARLGLVWVVILLPLYAFDVALAEAFETFPQLGTSGLMQWVTYILRTLVIVAFSGYMHARLVIYLPSAAYYAQPETWRGGWKRTRNHIGRLFLVFFIIGFVLSAAQLGMTMLAYRAPGYFGAVDFISELLGIRSNYVLRNLGQDIPFVLIGLPGTLLEAATSLVAFKALMPDQSTADIFN